MPTLERKWYDVTISGEYSVEQIKALFTGIAEKWAFQKEQGKETGYVHYQGKFCLLQPLAPKRVLELFQEFQIAKFHLTQSVRIGQWDYVTKSSTRLEGPWRWDDQPIPKWLRDENPNWYAWQKEVISWEPEARKVHLIFDPIGNTGKSFLANWLAVRKQACKIPVVGNYKDVMRAIFDREPSKRYFLDVPRAEKLTEGMVAAIESIKDGHIWDDRYKFSEKWMEPPVVVVFTNTEPNGQLSYDRWERHTIRGREFS